MKVRAGVRVQGMQYMPRKPTNRPQSSSAHAERVLGQGVWGLGFEDEDLGFGLRGLDCRAAGCARE